jgi:hypothetical protein
VAAFPHGAGSATAGFRVLLLLFGSHAESITLQRSESAPLRAVLQHGGQFAAPRQVLLYIAGRRSLLTHHR